MECLTVHVRAHETTPDFNDSLGNISVDTSSKSGGVSFILFALKYFTDLKHSYHAV